MSVRITEDAIHLEGRCLVEDAETLLLALRQSPHLPVDLAGLQRLHMAVAQVLFVLRPACRGRPSDAFLSGHVFGNVFDSDKPPESA